jgi:predicted nuclease of predicted toxin-antitoxin system
VIKFAADENLNNNLLRGMLRRNPEIDMVRIQDVGLSGADDPTILEWCAEQDRILLTSDVSTITKFAYQRIAAGQAMPGVLEIGRSGALATAIEDLLLIAVCSEPGDWEGRIHYLPLR